MAKPEYYYGVHSVESLLELEPERVLTLFTLKGRDDQRLQHILKMAEPFGISIQKASRDSLEKLAGQPFHQGVVAAVRPHPVLNEKDLEHFEYIKKCRNTLAHEMLKFTAEELDFEVSEVFSEMVNLLRKIELWWFENLEMAIDPDSYPEDFDLEQVTPGPVWSLQMLIDIALGEESEAIKYYDHFMAASEKA